MEDIRTGAAPLVNNYLVLRRNLIKRGFLIAFLSTEICFPFFFIFGYMSTARFSFFICYASFCFCCLSSILYSISRFLSLDVCFSAIHTLLPTELLFKISSILGFWRNETCPLFFGLLSFFLLTTLLCLTEDGFFFYALLYHVGFSLLHYIYFRRRGTYLQFWNLAPGARRLTLLESCVFGFGYSFIYYIPYLHLHPYFSPTFPPDP